MCETIIYHMIRCGRKQSSWVAKVMHMVEAVSQHARESIFWRKGKYKNENDSVFNFEHYDV